MPQLGESIAEATIVNLLARIGEHVETDQDIIKVETNQAHMDVASPSAVRASKPPTRPYRAPRVSRNPWRPRHQNNPIPLTTARTAGENRMGRETNRKAPKATGLVTPTGSR